MAFHLPELANSLPFPSRSTRQSISDLSIISTRATALDVCYSVYGEANSTADAVGRFYETNARERCLFCPFSISYLCAVVYENPFITASSRSVISDIHRLSRQLSSIDIPRPLAMLCTLFQIRPPGYTDPLFRALRVWTDVGDICESESFDGHRKAIVEHTLHILLLPNIHCEGPTSHRAQAASDSLISLTHSSYLTSHSLPFIIPSLPIPGTSLSFPSPLHSKLRIITRLSFNEQGLVTYHRDIWDVKDVMGLVPGVSLAQWIGTRLTALGLSYLAQLIPRHKSATHLDRNSEYDPEVVNLENGMNPSTVQESSPKDIQGGES